MSMVFDMRLQITSIEQLMVVAKDDESLTDTLEFYFSNGIAKSSKTIRYFADSDGWEVFWENWRIENGKTEGFDPLDSSDGSLNYDGDGITINGTWHDYTNADEYLYAGEVGEQCCFNPYLIDSDGDGLGDGWEAYWGTDWPD